MNMEINPSEYKVLIVDDVTVRCLSWTNRLWKTYVPHK